MPNNFQAYELAEGWPHKHLQAHPDEIHVSPRKAYFTRNGKVHAVPLETLTVEDINRAYDVLEENGVDKSTLGRTRVAQDPEATE